MSSNKKKPGAATPSGLLEVLERRGREEPDKVAFRFHKEPPCTYGVLWRECSRVGSVLLHRGVKLQVPVLIAIGNGFDFFYAFYGVQRAGGIAVPVFPGSGVERILKLTDLSGASIILVSGSFSRDKLQEL
ncbi:MAG: long-chain fatty acid--CoA ligase, partial [bacterium]|nr:long-chain fatty acid--CoA ligase [bacterium]